MSRGPALPHHRPDAPGTGGARRARRHQVGGGRPAVPPRGVRARPRSGCSTSSPSSASPTPTSSETPDGSDAVVGSRPGPDPDAPDRAALRPLRRAAAARRGGLAHPAVRADRGRTAAGTAGAPPTARATSSCTSLALRALGDDVPGEPEARRRGVRGAGHRRARGVRRRATPDLLRADTILVCDTGNAAVGHPAATVTLRGMVNVVVTVEALASELHSGMFGGAAPDALAALIAMLAITARRARQHHDHGPGQHPDLDRRALPARAVPRPTPACSTASSLLGDGSVSDMLWARPAVTVLGIDCPPVVGSAAAIVPRAAARLNLRVPPGMAADDAHDRAGRPPHGRRALGRPRHGGPGGHRVTVPGGRRRAGLRGHGRRDAGGLRHADDHAWARAGRSRSATSSPTPTRTRRSS